MHHHLLPSVEPNSAVLSSTEALELLKIRIEVVVKHQLLFYLDISNYEENDVNAFFDIQIIIT